jgi:hypothetical protein
MNFNFTERLPNEIHNMTRATNRPVGPPPLQRQTNEPDFYSYSPKTYSAFSQPKCKQCEDEVMNQLLLRPSGSITLDDLLLPSRCPHKTRDLDEFPQQRYSSREIVLDDLLSPQIEDITIGKYFTWKKGDNIYTSKRSIHGTGLIDDAMITISPQNTDEIIITTNETVQHFLLTEIPIGQSEIYSPETTLELEPLQPYMYIQNNVLYFTNGLNTIPVLTDVKSSFKTMIRNTTGLGLGKKYRQPKKTQMRKKKTKRRKSNRRR